jgi:hypothetical protein
LKFERIAYNGILTQFRFGDFDAKEFFNISNDVGRVKGLDVFVFAVSDTRVASASETLVRS